MKPFYLRWNLKEYRANHQVICIEGNYLSIQFKSSPTQMGLVAINQKRITGKLLSFRYLLIKWGTFTTGIYRNASITDPKVLDELEDNHGNTK